MFSLIDFIYFIFDSFIYFFESHHKFIDIFQKNT